MLAALGIAAAVATCAPWLMGRAPRFAGALLSAVPAGLFVYFSLQVPAVASGDFPRDAVAWIPALQVELAFRADGLSLLFALIISGVGFLIVVYALHYLKGRSYLDRFFLYLLLFMVSMLGLVLADNIFLLFVFWELTSYTSYLLIGFEHESKLAREAAWQALIVTAGGGLAMLAGLVLISEMAASATWSDIVQAGPRLTSHPQYGPALALVLVGAASKSALFPFHFWLPNAMQAPTPVSAYLHSSTMVKAGIYLLARCSPALGGTMMWTASLVFVGAATMVVSAYLTLEQTYVKRLLAHSTTWALGLMAMLLGIGGLHAVEAAMLWILAHALYKGALFMVAGNLDHGAGVKELRDAGGLRRVMPFTAAAAFIGGASMSGIAPTLGYVSKELLYATLLERPWPWWLASMATLTTAAMVLTAFKLVLVPFGGKVCTPRGGREVGVGMLLGPLLLAILGLSAMWFSEGLGRWLIDPAASAVLQRIVTYELVLWHGFDWPLRLSVASLILGSVGYVFRSQWERLRFVTARWSRFGPGALYGYTMACVPRFGRWLFERLQSGYLRRYTMIVTTFVVTLVGGTLLGRTLVHGALVARRTTTAAESITFSSWYELGVVSIVMAAAMGVVSSRNRLAAIALLGVIGYGIALLFLFFGAPDVALTQFVVETLTLIMFVLAFYRLPRFARLSTPRARARDAALAGAFGTLMAVLVYVTTRQPADARIGRYYGARSYVEGHGRNIVNTILVDFRAFDTLGEITVLLVAAIGVVALVRRPKPGSGR